MEGANVFVGADRVEVALNAGEKKLTELKNQLPVILKKIDESQLYLDLKRAASLGRQAFLDRMMQRMQELRHSHYKLQRASSEVTSEGVQAEQDARNVTRTSPSSQFLLKRLEVDVSEMLLRMLRDTQAELNHRLLEIQEHDYKKRIAEEDYKRLKEEERILNLGLEILTQQKLPMKNEVVGYGIQLRQVTTSMHGFQPQQTSMIRSIEQTGRTIKKGDVMMEEVTERKLATENVPWLACDRVQTPSPGPFDSTVLKWFSEEAYVPISRVKDFIEGEENREDFECKFTIRKTEDRFLSNGKKLIRYWCSFGPVDLRNQVLQSVRLGNIPEVGDGSRPSSNRKKLGFSSARGCRCHFAVVYFKDRPEACLIRWLIREHRDKDGSVCHGRLDAAAQRADDRSCGSTNSGGL